MKKKKTTEKRGRDLLMVVVIIVCLIFTVNISLLGHEYTEGVNEQAVARAQYCAEEQALYFNRAVDAYRNRAEYLAAQLGSTADRIALLNRITDCRPFLEGDARFRAVFFLCGGTLYDAQGEVCTEYPELAALATEEGTVLSRVFSYKNSLMAIGVSAPVAGPECDRVICVYDRDILTVPVLFTDTENLPACVSLSAITMLCKHDGRVLARRVTDSDFAIGGDTARDGVLPTLLPDTNDYRAAQNLIAAGKNGSFTVQSSKGDYILTVSSFGQTGGGLFLLSLYPTSAIYGDGYRLVNSIWGSLILFAVVTAVMVIFFAVRHLDLHRRISKIALENEALSCPTLTKFERDSRDILARNRATRFAMVILRVSNYDFLAAQYAAGGENGLLMHLRNTCRNAMLIDEVYAYGSGGEFWLLLHARDRRALSDRLSVLGHAAADLPLGGDGTYRANISFSIYEIDREQGDENVRAMMDKVTNARDASLGHNGPLVLNYYSDLMHESALRRAEIEGRMESALEKNEFHLFYQPKYNMKSGTLDGSEILVRWYDPQIGNYRQPSEFLRVFEETGFISKMDRFIFYRACENIAKRLSQRETVYPVSVNVSRVTAAQPDFVEYYTRIKQKFGIRDRFLTLEFTESFAYENYEYLAGVIKELHTAGFFCSLDDFGSGYSSFVPLKTLEMDEIKLDMALLAPGLSEERDDAILRSMIDMLHGLGVKVTQEGVGSQADFDRMAALGCDVIQGYYFAKPMKYTAYLEFVGQNFLPKDGAVH